MRLITALLVTLSAAATAVQAQNLSGLPDCAVDCFTSQLVNSACTDTTNVTCICEDTTYFSDVEFCVLSTCDTDGTSSMFPTKEQATLTWAAAGAPLRKVKRALEAIFGRKNHMLLRKEE